MFDCINQRMKMLTDTELGPVGRLLRTLSFILSIITMLGAICVIGFSIRTIVEFGYISDIIGTNALNYGAFTLLLVGISAFTITPVGLYSNILQEQTLITVYMVVTIGLGGLSIASAGMGILLKSQVTSGEVQTWLVESLQHEYGHPNGQDVTKAWATLQRQLVCCGVESPSAGTDWLVSDWFIAQTDFPRQRVPESCCPVCATIHEKFCFDFAIRRPDRRSLTRNVAICQRAIEVCSTSEGIFPELSVCTGQIMPPPGMPKDAYVHTQGCYEPLERSLHYYCNQMMVFGGIFAFLLFFCSCVSFARSELVSHPLYGPITLRR